MDLQEIRIRCLEMAAAAYAGRTEVASSYWAGKVIDHAKRLETWVLSAENDALKKLGKA